MTNFANGVQSKKPAAAITPEQAMKSFMHKLSAYEHHEIFNFPQVYFTGHMAKKKQANHGGPNNEGFDDDQGSYLLVGHDHISYRYEIIKIIGN